MAVLRDLALILLAVEALVLALVPLVLLGGLVYGLGWLQRRDKVPRWLRMARMYLERGCSYVDLGMGAAARPFLLADSARARFRRWSRAAFGYSEPDRREAPTLPAESEAPREGELRR